MPVSECVFVQNATTGVSTVLWNLEFEHDEVLVHFDTIYGGVQRGVEWLGERMGVERRVVEVDGMIGGGEIVGRFKQTIHEVQGQGKRVKVAVFDTIVSTPGFRFPFEELVGVCREEGVLSLLDAAHGVGQIPLDLGALRPDFLTSNCHKYSPPLSLSQCGWVGRADLFRWLYTPRGCAVLYVPLRHQHLIRSTLPTSWGWIPRPEPSGSAAGASATGAGARSKSPFEYLFEYTATTDDTAYLCVPAALEFREKVCGGETRIYEYCEALANEAADLLAEKLGTEVFQEPGLGSPGKGSLFRRCAMTTVRLPISVEDSGDKVRVQEQDGKMVAVVPRALVPAVFEWFREELFRAGTFVPVFEYRGFLWTRLSAQIYLERSDFEWLAGILKGLCERVEASLHGSMNWKL